MFEHFWTFFFSKVFKFAWKKIRNRLNRKKIKFQIFRFLFFVVWSFLYPNFRWIFHDNSKNKIPRILIIFLFHLYRKNKIRCWELRKQNQSILNHRQFFFRGYNTNNKIFPVTLLITVLRDTWKNINQHSNSNSFYFVFS